MSNASEKAQLADQLRRMPLAMRERSQWLLWRFMQYEGDKKPRKVPFYVSGRKRRGAQGSVEDRDELKGLEPTLTEFVRGHWDGVGFAFLPGDGLIGVDLDNAVDSETGEISARCRAIVSACASYTEWSPSGRGVHIICEGKTETFKDNSIGVEVFCGKQFFTCTGQHWSDTPEEVRPIAGGALNRLRATVKAARAKPEKGADGPVQASAPNAPPAKERGEDDFARVNSAAMARLGDWVPALFPGAVRQEGTGAWRVKSKDLGRDLQEDLSIAPDGIVDWGVADMGDPREGRRTPIDLVMWRLGGKAKDALLWLAGRLGEPLSPKSVKRREDPPVGGGELTPLQGSAEEGDQQAGRKAQRDWRDELLRKNGGKADCRENVYLVLVNHPTLRGLVGYDEFSHRVMKLKRPPWDSDLGEWTTNDDYFLGFWLAQHERLVVKGEGTIVAGVAMAAYANRFHPVLKYLKELPPWDGIGRLGHWLHECLGAEDSDYTRLVGTWFLMGMVKRIHEPGCQMDYVVVLEGLQGKRKSTSLRTLVGNDDWFADTPIRIGDKDALLSLAGKWLYEVGELDSFNKAEVTAVKQYVSSRIDRVREPFARRPADRPRSGVFAATTNQAEYFKDPTGSRRFWPVACDGEIDLAKLAQWRDQMFAEAMHRLASDDEEIRRFWPNREETEKYLVPQQERREIADPWFEKLAIWLDGTDIYDDSGRQVCEVNSFYIHELLSKCLHVPVDRIDGGRAMATRVGTAMHKLGWRKDRDSTGARLYRYYRPKQDSEAKQAIVPVSEGVPSEVAGVPQEHIKGVPSEVFDA